MTNGDSINPAYILFGIVGLGVLWAIVYHFQAYIFIALIIGALISVIFQIKWLGAICFILFGLMVWLVNSYDRDQHTLDHKNRR